MVVCARSFSRKSSWSGQAACVGDLIVLYFAIAQRERERGCRGMAVHTHTRFFDRRGEERKERYWTSGQNERKKQKEEEERTVARALSLSLASCRTNQRRWCEPSLIEYWWGGPPVTGVAQVANREGPSHTHTHCEISRWWCALRTWPSSAANYWSPFAG